MKLMNVNNFDEFEIQGVILLEDQEIQGTLKSDGSNYKLNFNIEHHIELDNKSIEFKFVTVKGELVFLKKGIETKLNMNFPGLCECEYVFSQIWVSNNKTEIPEKFEGVKIQFSGLKENIFESPFEIVINKDKSEYSIRVDKENNKKKILSLEEVDLYSLSYWTRKITSPPECEFHFENKLELIYSTDRCSEKCISDAIELSYIFSLITNEKHKIENITLYSSENYYRVFLSLPFNFKEYHKTTITYKTSDILKKYLPDIYKFFWNNKDELEDIFSGYIKLMYTPKFINHYLVDLLKLNEGLHRRFINNNKVNLVDRYNELLNSLEDNLQKHLTSIVNFDEELHEYLKDFRHYHSHYYPIEEKPIYSKDTMYNISNYVLQLHKTFLLTKIGISSEDIIALLKMTH